MTIRSWVARTILAGVVTFGLVGATPLWAATHRYNARAAQKRHAKVAAIRAARARRARLEARPQFTRLADGTLVPAVRARAAIILDPATNTVLFEKDSHDKQSIASITKVMTALVFLSEEPDMTRDVEIEDTDVIGASHTRMRAGEHIRLEDLLHAMLMASDNAAARAIARTSQDGWDAFIAKMNAKATELGLEDTTYADPSGLDARNVSSAYDMARLIKVAASTEEIARIMQTRDYTFSTDKRTIRIGNTDALLRSSFDVMAGKTGFINKSGYCFATLLRMPEGQEVAVVVLGARSNRGRFLETLHLANWLSKTKGLLATTHTPLQ